MHLDGPGFAHHPHELTGGGAPHDRIIDQHDSFAVEVLGNRIQLEPDTAVAEHLRRLDERSPDIAVLHQTVGIGNVALGRESLGRRNAGLGNGDYDIRLDRCFCGESPAHPLSGTVHVLPVQVAVRSGEIDELEDAEARVHLCERMQAPDAARVDHNHLPGLDLPNEGCTHQIESGRLRGEDPAPFGERSQTERAVAVGVAYADQVALIHDHEGESTFQVRKHLRQGSLELAPVRSSVVNGAGNGVEHEHGVGGTGVVADPGGQLDRIRQVSVVAQSYTGVFDLAIGRLRVLPDGRSAGGVTGVADAEVAGKRGECRLMEHLGDEPHVLEDGDGLTVRGGDPGALLPAMLEGEKAERDYVCGVLTRRIHAENATFLARGGLEGPVHFDGDCRRPGERNCAGRDRRPVSVVHPVADGTAPGGCRRIERYGGLDPAIPREVDR